MSISVDVKSPDTDRCTPLAPNRPEKLGAGSCPFEPLIVIMSVLIDNSSSDALDLDNSAPACVADSEALV